MAPPPVLSRLLIIVGANGHLTATRDGSPYPESDGQELDRASIGALLDQLPSSTDEPVLVEIVESDGSTFSDILLPHREAATTSKPTATPRRPSTDSTPGWLGVTGGGFVPGESVAVAVVVASLAADPDGVACLRLPARVLAGRTSGIALIGDASGAVARALPKDEGGMS